MSPKFALSSLPPGSIYLASITCNCVPQRFLDHSSELLDEFNKCQSCHGLIEIAGHQNSGYMQNRKRFLVLLAQIPNSLLATSLFPNVTVLLGKFGSRKINLEKCDFSQWLRVVKGTSFSVRSVFKSQLWHYCSFRMGVIIVSILIRLWRGENEIITESAYLFNLAQNEYSLNVTVVRIIIHCFFCV